MKNRIRACVRATYEAIRNESVTYGELKEKLEQYAKNVTYSDCLLGELVSREFKDMFSKDIGSLPIDK